MSERHVLILFSSFVIAIKVNTCEHGQAAIAQLLEHSSAACNNTNNNSARPSKKVSTLGKVVCINNKAKLH
jgi:hypothetical protein